MIHILDEIELAAEHVPTVLALLEQRYLPGLPQRHTLTLAQRWVSPPVSLPGRPNTLWLLWQVTDELGYYTMRGTAGPEVAAFWQEVDALCSGRRRHVLTDATQLLPQPLATEESRHGA